MTIELTPPSRRRLLGRLWAAYWVVLFILTHTRLEAFPTPSFSYADKLEHFGSYFLLTYLGGRFWLAGKVGSPGRVLLLWAGIYAAYGGFDEWLQQFVERTMSLYDWLADAAGIALASVVLAWNKRRRAGS